MCYCCGTMQRCATVEGTPPASGLRQSYYAPDKGKEKLFPLMCGEGNLQWYNAEVYYHWGWRQDKNYFFFNCKNAIQIKDIFWIPIWVRLRECCECLTSESDFKAGLWVPWIILLPPIWILCLITAIVC